MTLDIGVCMEYNNHCVVYGIKDFNVIFCLLKIIRVIEIENLL